MADIEAYKNALIKADRKGDKKAANFFASKIKELSQQQPQQPQQGQTVFTGDFVPTDEAMAQQGGKFNQAQEKDFTAREQLVAGLETAGTLVTGATTGAGGFLLGSLGGAIGELTGLLDEGQGYKLAEDAAAALTFTPKTEAGQQLIKEIAEPLSALPPVIMGAPQVITLPTAKALTASSKAASKGIGAVKRVAQNASATKKVLADEIAAGNINTGNIAKTLDADGTLITNPKTKAAMGLIDNKEAAYSAAINFELMNPSTKSQASKALNVIEENYRSGDPVKIMENRPAKVVGESLANRALKLNKVKQKASNSIKTLIEGDFGSTSIGTQKPLSSFINELSEAGIPVNDNKGKLSVDLSESIINLNEVMTEPKLNIILNKLNKGNITAKESHRLKRQLNEAVSYDPQAVGTTKVSKEIESAVKNLSSALNESMREASPIYKKANERYSNVIDALKSADKMLGNNIMIGDDLAASKLGSLAKRIGTNLASKEQVYDLIDSLDTAIAKSVPKKDRPQDDIRRQVAFLADLEKIFNVESAQSPFGFQSRIAQGALEAATGSPTGVMAETGKFVLDRFRAMSKQDFNDKMKATRSLLRESRKQEQN